VATVPTRYGPWVELKAIRCRLGIRQVDLAELAGISQQYLSFLESGRRWPRPDAIIAIAAALGVPPRILTRADLETEAEPVPIVDLETEVEPVPKSEPDYSGPYAAAARRYAKISDAATYVDVHPMTIRQMIADGKIRAYRSGQRLIRVDLNELDAMLLAGETANLETEAEPCPTAS
jgi:excisionase family DNA binding protein